MSQVDTGFQEPEPGALSRRTPVWLAGMVLAGLPIFYFSYLKRAFQLDDALIYLRYVRNVLEGRGLVYNTGERFNALTSPLFSYLSVLLGWALDDPQIAAILLSTFCYWVFALVMALIFFPGDLIRQMLLVAVVGVTPPFLYLTYGMESTLLMMMCALLLWAYQGNRLFWVGVFAGLIAMTRTEGLLLPLFVLIDYLLKNKRLPQIKYFVAPVVLVGASYVFNYLYYGHVLPDSLFAKLGQGKSGLWGRGWVFLKYGYLKSWVFHSNTLYMYACFASGLLGLWRFRSSAITRIVVPYVLAYVAVCTIAGVPNYHWYATPVFAFGSVYAALGVVGPLQRAVGRIDRWLGLPTAILLGAYLLFHGVRYSNEPAAPHEPYRQIGLWLKQNTEPMDKIAMVEVGTVGWYSERHIIDILGLVTPLNAKFVAERKLTEWLNHYSPEYILLHDPPIPHERWSAKDPRVAQGYGPDSRFQHPGYQLLKRLDI